MKKYRFRLYVAGNSANSLAAQANFRRLCDDLPQDSWELDVVDLLERPKEALTAGVFVTPTLELGEPAAGVRVVGTLADRAVVRALLGLP